MMTDASEAPRGEPSLAAQRPLLGTLVEQRYRVVAHIGSGGMADVYEVEHATLGRRLAMKVLRHAGSTDPRQVRRFSREACAASRLESEHIVSIHDYGQLPDGHPYFVMDLLRGQNLRQLLVSERRLPVGRAVNIAIDVCLGLHVAHAAGLVHRDLKPENLWLSKGDDGRELCVLLDFGVARFDGAHTTGDGVLVGTARYMSPEQIGSEQAPGPGSDLFSLGLLVYESLTGSLPFAADSLERTLFRILNDTAPAVSDINAEVPVELSHVIDKLLSKAPERRYAGALELAAALRPFAGVARLLPLPGGGGASVSAETVADVSAPSPRGAEPAGSLRRSARGRRASWLSFAAGLLSGAAALFLLRPMSEPQRAALPTAGAPAIARSSAPTAMAGALPAAGSSAPPPTLAAAEPLRSPPRPRVRPTSQAASALPAPTPARPEPPRPTFDGRNPYLP